MYNYIYVSKNQRKEQKKDIIKLLNLVQDEVRKEFTFRYDFIGSDSRNMVTYDPKSNVGYDFDVNIRINDPEECYSPKEIKKILRAGFDKYVKKFNFDYSEDSSRVITIKVKDTKNSKIIYSCDFAVVRDFEDGSQQYLRFNKDTKCYVWEWQPEGYYLLPERIELIKENGLWQEVRDLYIEKKNKNTDKNKKSRTIFAETINEIVTNYDLEYDEDDYYDDEDDDYWD